MALRAARAYRTVSFDAACLLAGMPPWDLKVGVLAAVYRRVVEANDAGDRPHPREVAKWRDEERVVLVRRWAERLSNPGASRELVGAIRPVLKRWAERGHGVITFHLTQMLTGHGCFGEYLCRVAGREPNAECHHCGSGAADTAEHTRVECPAWALPRAAMTAAIGEDLSLPTIIKRMVDSDEPWEKVATFCDAVLLQKEEAEREREKDPLADPVRRIRRGRRRRAFAAQTLQ